MSLTAGNRAVQRRGAVLWPLAEVDMSANEYPPKATR
jgi:hypothetical protein